MEVTMDPLFLAWSYFRRRKLQQCADICTKILQDSPYDQVLAVSFLAISFLAIILHGKPTFTLNLLVHHPDNQLP